MEKNKEKNQGAFCSKCGSPKTKTWDDLTADEKFLVERMPAAGEMFAAARKKERLFCARCFYEIPGGAAENA